MADYQNTVGLFLLPTGDLAAITWEGADRDGNSELKYDPNGIDMRFLHKYRVHGEICAENVGQDVEKNQAKEDRELNFVSTVEEHLW